MKKYLPYIIGGAVVFVAAWLLWGRKAAATPGNILHSAATAIGLGTVAKPAGSGRPAAAGQSLPDGWTVLPPPSAGGLSGGAINDNDSSTRSSGVEVQWSTLR